ncbi:unnamed protein product, partial [Trichogramma brassicae]
ARPGAAGEDRRSRRFLRLLQWRRWRQQRIRAAATDRVFKIENVVDFSNRYATSACTAHRLPGWPALPSICSLYYSHTRAPHSRTTTAATEVELDMFRSLYVRCARAYYLFEECKLAFEELRNNFQKQRIHRKVIAKVHMIARCVGYGAIFESTGLLSYPVMYRYV